MKMLKKPSDQIARQQALDISASFIVQAPAGSGKTELLTQRYLKLLAHAEQNPEEILAITFTRKAAAEMKARILKALQRAKAPESNSEQHSATRALAKAVLKRDTALNWQLLKNQNRLKIQTIDGFCSSITKQMPLLSQFGSQTDVCMEPKKLYQAAIHQLLEGLSSNNTWGSALQTLLIHLDNRSDRLESLLINLLQRRDQWLSHIVIAKNNKQLRETLEVGLSVISEESIAQIESHLNPALKTELIEISQFAAANLQKDGSHTAISLCWPNEQDTLENSRHFYLGIAELLLTKADQLRRSVTKKQGIPAPSSSKDKTTKACLQSMKDRLLSLLERLHDESDFIAALQAFRHTPPLRYPDTQWHILEALLEVLPVAVAQLRLVFQHTTQVDFAEVSQAALQALGDAENTTDLALALDYKIKHLLVDEFQDTSITQFRLLEKLTAGWTNQEARTLFLVGDPMQSIYRFRDAEVGLFLRAQTQGIGDLTLTSLQLKENFRSSANIVKAINQTFQAIFPADNNIATGAVSYSSSRAFHEKDHTGLRCHAVLDGEHEAQLVAELTQVHDGSTAILVQARSHLYDILPILKANHIPYQAIEIDALYSKPVVQDLIALTKALLHPADSVAWLAILRAPWCGLTLEALHHIANHRGRKTIWQQLNRAEVIEKLDEKMRDRALFLQATMSTALKQYRQLGLYELVKNTWLQLQGHLCLEQVSDFEDADAYFDFLDRIDTAANIQDFEEFETQLQQLYSSANNTDNNAVQILTIHKSKGLEFDHIIIPGLGRLKGKDRTSLLLWLERPRQSHNSDLILAPLHSTYEEKDPIYEYLQTQHKTKGRHEDLRLLYVAMTRAKHALHLIAEVDVDKETGEYKPPSNTLLHRLWPALQNEFVQNLYQDPIKASFSNHSGDLKRLTQIHFTAPDMTLESEAISHLKPQDFIWQDKTAAAVGTVAHHVLQTISESDLNTWDQACVESKAAHWKALLTTAGINRDNLEEALCKTMLAVNNTLGDEKGRWILSARNNAASELALSKSQDGNMEQFILDRTFVDENNVRWIVDYKIAEQQGELQDFIEQQAKQYQAQLMQYAELLGKLYPNDTIRCALYFPLQTAFFEIEGVIA